MEIKNKRNIYNPYLHRANKIDELLNMKSNGDMIVFIVIDDDDKEKEIYIKKISNLNNYFIIILKQISYGIPMVRQSIKIFTEYLLSKILTIEDHEYKYWIELDDDIAGFQYEDKLLNIKQGLNINQL